MSQQFDPHDFYGKKPVAPGPAPVRSTFGQMPANDFGAVPAARVPAKTPVPTWAKVLIALGVLGAGLVVLGILAAIAIPVFLNQRAEAADLEVKKDLQAVASAQHQVMANTGTYTLDPLALGIPEPASDVAIVAADSYDFCLAGRPHGDGGATVWFYSLGGGMSTTPCA
jgi:type IV pilus assembly protein PilA